jgi:hypothetical protein
MSRFAKAALAIAASFVSLVGLTIYLTSAAVLTPQQGLLMLVALAALYIGFGILVVARRLVDKLD